ncbi:bifunctional 3-phenylpropionate/cinnamic acid dioxygenase ferredoxin subunit [Streptomyces silvisoli]|uniref:Bifunctional 3-phenylpropionate/cinnamic acid dioxygenase ferredoxin subunit n=1 Tax=Streptomyces silvisoli TaxID=3034235 RepID=A0ABT5ZLN6_9ACTN|nr:bifunctional 3-phenylpropionate/cinnamic acid dioxygenase ferredoxin subunit [Streptomyces silvisoli]MDF3290514.1 bifunctional 3-phenylpropionate/cinnamic acid dioxygenase ferredoxin subunit [Streptomyces silvisoli]
MMIPVCRLVDLPRGEAFRLETVPPVAVFHTDDGELFAIDDTCTHQDAALSDGWLEGCAVECPLHASKFDLRTGLADGLPARLPVRTHQVLVEHGMVYVLLCDTPPLPRGAVAYPVKASE